MALRLANEADCKWFKFWLETSLQDGICCQGEFFVHLQTLPAKHRARAYEIAAHLAEQTSRVVMICGKERYGIGVDLQGGLWRDRASLRVMPEPTLLHKLRATLNQSPHVSGKPSEGAALPLKSSLPR
jgi:hypothetical protein